MQAFHVFHISCLIHWILFCESKGWNSSKSMSRRINAVSKKHVAGESSAQRSPNGNPTSSTISSAFCPECQGSGLKVEDDLEVPRLPLSEVCSPPVSVAIYVLKSSICSSMLHLTCQSCLSWSRVIFNLFVSVGDIFFIFRCLPV